MEKIKGNNVSINNKTHQIIAWSLLLGLLLLRIPFRGLIPLFIQQSWIDIVWQIGTYFLTACLLWWERDHLGDFYTDKLALIIIIIFKPVQTVMSAILNYKGDPFSFPHWPGLIFWIISIGLLLALLLNHPHLAKLSKASFGWFGFGILVGLVTIILIGYPESFQITGIPSLRWSDIFPLIVHDLPGFFHQLGYAAVAEEPLFRGFLWGYLLKAGWKNVWIWLFQAGLFMLAHIYDINKFPISFWFLIPLGSLVSGALVWRSKTISTSLAAHAIMNTLGARIGFIIASFRM